MPLPPTKTFAFRIVACTYVFCSGRHYPLKHWRATKASSVHDKEKCAESGATRTFLKASDTSTFDGKIPCFGDLNQSPGIWSEG